MCETVEKPPVLEAIEKARKAQQLYDLNNDVQLEIDLEEEKDYGPKIRNYNRRRYS